MKCIISRSNEVWATDEWIKEHSPYKNAVFENDAWIININTLENLLELCLDIVHPLIITYNNHILK